MSKKILVIGATGFVGSALIKTLIHLNYNVFTGGRQYKENIPKLISDKYIKIDFDNIKNNSKKFDVVINCAVLIKSEKKKWSDIEYVNCSLVEKIIDSLNYDKLIHLSTYSIFSRNSLVHNQPEPNNLYGLSKYVSEKLIELKTKVGKNSIVLRYPIIIGKNKKSSDVIKYMLDSSFSGKPVELYNGGEQLRNIIHISEVIKSIINSIDAKVKGFLTINIGSSDMLSTKDIYHFICKRFNHKKNINLNTKKSEFDFNFFIDVSKSMLIGYKSISAEKNLELFLREYDEV